MFCQKKNAYEALGDKYKKEIFEFSERYKAFLDAAKTEREAVRESVSILSANGFKCWNGVDPLKAGDRIYVVNRNKNIFAAVIGSEPVENGINLVVAHVDAPRLDLKQNPLYEDTGIALFDTHYYGGIKNYQWTVIPLAMHGVIVKADGTKAEISIGEGENDPVFTISDLLPHLAKDQMAKKMSEGVHAENLNIIIGSMPVEAEKEKVKAGALEILKNNFGICEEDFISAEIEFVPAFKAKDVGFDRSLVGAYGHDDRVCGYAALEAVLKVEKPAKTAVVFLADKEEIGSMGNTGMMSRFFEDTLAYICKASGSEDAGWSLRRLLGNSVCLSADVGVAYDPNYKEVQDINNAPQLNHGLVITKYTGSRGKSSSNDAHAELVGKIRTLFNDNEVAWQIGELGKVDQGGGGTVAQFMANLNIDTIDCGVALLSMHAPYEIAAKLDIYMAYKGYNAFLNASAE